MLLGQSAKAAGPLAEGYGGDGVYTIEFVDCL